MKLLHALTGCLALALTLPAYAETGASCATVSEESLNQVMDALSGGELKAFAANCRQEAKDLGRQAEAASDPQEKAAIEAAVQKAFDNAAIAGYVASLKK